MKNWDDVLITSLTTFWEQLAIYTPRVLGAIILIIVGWLISWLVSKSFHAIIKRVGFNKLCDHIGLTQLMENLKIKSTPAMFVSKLIFWILFLLAITSVSNTLGLTNVSSTIQSFVLFIPKVLFALVIFTIGIALAKIATNVIEKSLKSIGFASAPTVASMIQGLLIVLSAIIALEQLEIQTQFVYYIILVVLITIGLVLAISIGLGTKKLSQQIISGFYARDNIKPGDVVHYEKTKGTVVRVGSCVTEIDTGKSTTILIPNDELISSVITLEKNN